MGKFFTMEEMYASNTAERKGIDNTPDASARRHIAALIINVLDPIREAWGKPIRVNSGYRCPELNRHVGGVSNSQHVKGMAADLDDVGGDNKGLFECIKTLHAEGKITFDQLIDESNLSWIHISYSNANRNQMLKL